MKSSLAYVELVPQDRPPSDGSSSCSESTGGWRWETRSDGESSSVCSSAPEEHGGPNGPFGWLAGLKRRIGCRLLVLLFFIQHLLKGSANTLAWKSLPYLYRRCRLPAQQVQILDTVVGLPWVLKPVVGLISDICPLWGRRKAPYMALASALGVGACAAVGLLPLPETPVHLLVGCLFLFQNQVTTTDLLSEALWAERLQANPALGPDLLTFVFAGNQAACGVAVVASGFVIERLGAQAAFLIAAMLACGVAYPLARGYTDEHVMTAEAITEVRRKFWKQRETCALAVVMLACAAGICVTALLLDDPAWSAAVSWTAAGVVLVAFSLALSPVIAKFAAFSLIQTSMSLSVSGPAFYFMTDTQREYPEGPHFSAVFFNTVLGCLGGLCSLLGFATYRAFSTKIAYRSLLLAANLALSLLHLGDMLLFSRTNLRLGLPDQLFVLGGATLAPAIAQWHWMPQVALFSSLCPKDMEATMFALVVGCHNLGVSVAASTGSLLLHLLGCNPRGGPGDGEQLRHLWIASGVSSLLPLVSMLLLFRLVPEGRQGERLGPEGGPDATAGSLWRRFAGRTE